MVFIIQFKNNIYIYIIYIMSGKTAKQISSAMKKRSTTLKNLDKIYRETRDLGERIETIRINWIDCMDTNVHPFELQLPKKELKKKEAPCKKMRSDMEKLSKKQKKLYDKAEGLERIAGDIEVEFGIPANASY